MWDPNLSRGVEKNKNSVQTRRVGKYLTDNEWKIFNRQRMLVIDGKYNNEDGMSTRIF
jgi:hypothetical protein